MVPYTKFHQYADNPQYIDNLAYIENFALDFFAGGSIIIFNFNI